MAVETENRFEIRGVGDSETTIININDLCVFGFRLDGLKRFRARINERIEFLEMRERVKAPKPQAE